MAVYLIQQNDKNDDDAMNIQELVDVRVPCFSHRRGCFTPGEFPNPPRTLNNFFEDIYSPWNSGFEARSLSFLESIVNDADLWTGN